MEIEVGDYVRTRAGHFYKVTKIDKNGLVYWNKIQCGWSIEQLKDIIVKHSKNIIDLIEIEDVVKVKDHDWIRIFNIDDENILESFIEDCNENNWTLLSIVTHEQFENIEYKVEEDK